MRENRVNLDEVQRDAESAVEFARSISNRMLSQQEVIEAALSAVWPVIADLEDRLEVYRDRYGFG